MERIGDEEILFRRVLARSRSYEPQAPFRISGQAFTDRDYEPSVDRESVLRADGLDATFTAQGEENGVLRLRCSTVRTGLVHNKISYETDVAPRAEDENRAHCVLLMRPPAPNSGAFKRFIEYLALVVNNDADCWAIRPVDLRPGSGEAGT